MSDNVKKQAHIDRLKREYQLCVKRARTLTASGSPAVALEWIRSAENKSDLILCLETGEMSVEELTE